MSKNKNVNVATSLKSAFGIEMGGATEAPTTKVKYVCPINRVDFAANAKALWLHIGGETVQLDVKPVADEKALGWSFASHVVALGNGVEAYVSPYGVWIKNSKALSNDTTFQAGWAKMPKALPWAISADEAGKKTLASGEMHKCKSDGGAVGYTPTGETAQSYPTELDFGGVKAKAVINRFGLFLTNSKS